MFKRYRLALFLTLFIISAVALSACDLGSSSQDSAVPTTAVAVPTEQAPTVSPVVQQSPSAARAAPPAQVVEPTIAPTVPTQAPEPTQQPEPTVSANPTQAPAPTRAPSPTEAPAPTSQPEPTAAASPTQAPDTDTEMVIEGTSNGTDAVMVSLSPAAEELTTVDVVKLLKPSIVQIVSEIAAMRFSNSPLPPTGVGTGVILDQQGNILTNNHVIEDAQSLTVTLESGESFPAQIIGRDEVTDLAVIRIQADNLQPAKLGVAAEVEVGEDVIAIGHALGLSGGPTVSKGVVSALGRSINTDQNVTIIDLIQTDA
ncbi:MAG: trypsin-like peptidase domain-containing protein, partial [SAR202 cluster bacterium]|nr:trypsin-like peptidase domain-containing protein [SAR202 cluster bacterium]